MYIACIYFCVLRTKRLISWSTRLGMISQAVMSSGLSSRYTNDKIVSHEYSKHTNLSNMPQRGFKPASGVVRIGRFFRVCCDVHRRRIDRGTGVLATCSISINQ